MTDKKMITQKELNYIETLYLYCNLQDFANSDDHPTLKYFNVRSWLENVLLFDCKHTSDANGRKWYKCPNYNIGIMDYNIAKSSNQFNILIQYNQKHMFTLRSDLSDLDLPFGNEDDLGKYHINRIDITKIAKQKLDFTKRYDFISSFRTKSNYRGTIYLGNRENGNVFRMYNKTKELQSTENGKKIDSKKIELLSEYFGDIENLYTYELELRRSHLKENLGIETLLDLDKVFDVYKNTVGSIRIFKDNDSNRRKLDNKHHNRIFAWKITDYVEYERVSKKRYKTSFDYAGQSVLKTIDNHIDSMGEKRTNDEYLKFVNYIFSERIDLIDESMIIGIEDTVYSDDMAQMTAKHIDMRDNQSNELELEAERHLGTKLKKDK